MNTIKTLALAAIAALSVGVGAAMAQSEGPSAPDPNMDINQQYTVPPQGSHAVAPSSMVQSGSSDVDLSRPASIERDPNYYVNYGTIANPG